MSDRVKVRQVEKRSNVTYAIWSVTCPGCGEVYRGNWWRYAVLVKAREHAGHGAT